MDAASRRRLDSSWLPNFVVSEVGVNCNSVAVEICDGIPDLEAHVASVGEVLLCHIVWKFTLIEIYFSMVSVPLDEVSEIML